MAGYSRAELQYMINHAVLPPRLPEQPEAEAFVEAAEKALLDELLTVLRRFLPNCPSEFKPPWTLVQRMLSRCTTAKIVNDLSQKRLTEAISSMEAGGELEPYYQ